MKSAVARNSAAFARKLAVEFDEKKVDAIFAELNQCHLPGAAVGIAVGGRPLYRKGFGLANMELPIVLSPSMRMRIGSTTKHFTAFAFMLLCEEGKASIDDPLGKYIPELHSVTRQVTMRQLMGNTSGLRDACDIRFQFSGTTGRLTSRDDIVAFYRGIDDVNAPPGTTYIYNNGGWVLVSAVIERVTGQSFEDVMRKLVFEPIGMNDSLVRAWDTDFVSNSATPHTTNRAGQFEKAYWNLDFAGAGTVVSTVDDMLRWSHNMDTRTVGSAATWGAIRTPQTLQNGTSTGYGLGMITTLYRGVETCHHAGGYSGCYSQLLKVPEADLDIVLLLNRDDVSGVALVHRIIDACVPELDSVRKKAAPVTTGVYKSSTSGRVVQLFPRGDFQMVSLDGLDLPFERSEDGTLKSWAPTAQMKWDVKLAGDVRKPTAIRFSDFGNAEDMVSVPPIANPDIDAIEGKYRSVTTGTELTIFATEDGARMTARGRFGTTDSSLECLADGIWRSRSLGLVLPISGILVFANDRAAFRLSNGVTRDLVFTRVT